MRHGQQENNVIALLKVKPLTIKEIINKLNLNNDHTTIVSMGKTLRNLISKGNIKKTDKTYQLIKEFEVVGRIRATGNNGKVVSIPKINQTKHWKIGDKVQITHSK